MNMQRRFGVLTAIAGAALALGSLTFTGSATAVEQPPNDHDVDHENITRCPAGTTQFDGPITTGSGSTALFHWVVASNTYVTITQIDPTVTGLTAYLKGGDGYRVYDPVISGQEMRSPLNDGHQIPNLSHWMLCSTITPVATTTTTLPVIDTTTTVVDTTTTVPDVVTTTTIGESGGPTTTMAATTTTEQASEGPTTTEQAAEGPTTTVEEGPLPTTGSGGTSLLLVLGLAMSVGGVLFTLLARTPREN